MVFEQIFQAEWLHTKSRYAFVMGLGYSLIAISSAMVIFPSNPGLMAVAFTALLILPSLNTLLSDEENEEIRENKFSVVALFRDHWDIIKIYMFLFLGIFFTFSIITLFFPKTMILTLFSDQLKVAGITGRATLTGQLSMIVLNNLLVFLVCFVLSLIYGAGAILFITWNATVWGSVFGYFIKETASTYNQDPIITFFVNFLPFLPHMITEAVSYFFAAIVGGVMSKALLREKLFSKEFNHIITDALFFIGLGLILVLMAGFIEVAVFS